MIRRSVSFSGSAFCTLTLFITLALFNTLANPLAASESTPPATTTLDWLAGCWSGDSGEECWLRADGGLMVGVNRSPGGSMFEFLRITQEDDGAWIYHASPKGRCPATAFTATHVDTQRVVFENPQHDFPQRIEYWLDDSDHLHARISADRDGTTQAVEITWQRGTWSAN